MDYTFFIVLFLIACLVFLIIVSQIRDDISKICDILSKHYEVTVKQPEHNETAEPSDKD